MDRLQRMGLILGFILTATGSASAHPHMSLEYRLEFELKGRECVGIRVEWLFDSMFSAAIIREYDANHDGKFSKAENENIRQRAFANLEHYGYFVILRKGRARSAPQKSGLCQVIDNRIGVVLDRPRILGRIGLRNTHGLPSIPAGSGSC